ncbi:hypothetical protein UY3_12613 [Chelonia mydas]|uniref:Myb/SANT-like DNA-binding domain-containing protein n=1 Tax=Chelonia mydas TaxID=8469 RepID=M7BDS0_CHEMY|nr:hypothetical protein UY3_12613 [Chelonia mydas]
MPPSARRSPVWSNGEVQDLISVWREEVVQSQLHSSRRNYGTFWQISRDMLERDHDRDALQCRIKVKELRNAYRKAHKAKSRSSAAPSTCHFYKELDVILGGDPTSTPRTTMDTSEPSATRHREEEESGSKGAKGGRHPGIPRSMQPGAALKPGAGRRRKAGARVLREEDTPESLEACSQELLSSQEEGSQSRLLVLGEGQTPEEVPGKRLLFWEGSNLVRALGGGGLGLHACLDAE